MLALSEILGFVDSGYAVPKESPPISLVDLPLFIKALKKAHSPTKCCLVSGAVLHSLQVGFTAYLLKAALFAWSIYVPSTLGCGTSHS